MSMNSADDLFRYNLEGMYYVENRLVDVLGDMAESTTDDDLREGFEEHREETRRQIERLEEVFRAVGEQPEERRSPALEGLVEERERFLSENPSDDVENLFSMTAAMKSERLEITGYQGLLELADRLDYGGDVTDPLEENLDEEKGTLRELEGMAKGSKLTKLFGKLTK
jgi:ferritin-like metal-binding protein YciE